MLNKVVLCGRLTKDPETVSSQSGVIITKFKVAVNRRFKKDETDFINIVTFNKTAEFVQKYFKKGQAILLCGSIQTRTYEKDGENRWVTEVIADEVNFCGSKNDNKSESYSPEETEDVLEQLRGNNAEFMPVGDNDDLPF